MTGVNCAVAHQVHKRGECVPFPCRCGEQSFYGLGAHWLCLRCYLAAMAILGAAMKRVAS